MEQILVSVCCLAYNHEKYIRDALEGFIHQKTSFPYEVIVHDDASTDKTAEIIREYAAKYPGIIRPVIQTENQHSKGVRIFNTFIFPRMRGKYIAVCEGDDYWCDENKLQRQADWLEQHPEYAFCGHNTRIINCLTGEEKPFSSSDADCDVSMEDLILKTRPFFHTSSFMFRAEYAVIPEGFLNGVLSDYPRALYMETCGKVRFLHETMSVYRQFADGSWTVRTHRSAESRDREQKVYRAIIKTLRYTDQYTNGAYTELITDLVRKNELKLLLSTDDLKTAKAEYGDLIARMERSEKIRFYIRLYFPAFVRLYRRIRKP